MVFEHNPFHPLTRLAVSRCAFDFDATLLRPGRLQGLMREVGFAFMQVMRTGSDSQITLARDVLTGTRRDLYRILADGDGEAGNVPADK